MERKYTDEQLDAFVEMAFATHVTGQALLDLVADARLANRLQAAEAEELGLHRLVKRQSNLLRGVVNAIRGQPGSLALHSTHDAVELVKVAMRVVRAARALDRAHAEFSGTPSTVHRDIADNSQLLHDAVAAFDNAVRDEEPCESCGGSGQVTNMVCYGGPPHEKTETCDDCKGEGFVPAKPLTDPGVALPGWQETFQKAEAGLALNPIEILICRLTPGDDERGKDFRRMLRAALDYTAEQAKAVQS